MTDQNTNNEIEQQAMRAMLGEQVRAFMESDVGVWLDGKMQDEYLSAVGEFADVDPTDVPAVMKIQNKMIRAQGTRQWFEDAISQGLEALRVLESRDEQL